MPALNSTPNAPSHAPTPKKRTYAEKLLDPRWQKKRLEVFNAAGWRCQECAAEDRTLAVHHSFYPTGKEPWEVEGDLLLALCERHHKERQALEQRIFVGIARRLCQLNLRGLRAVGGSGVATVAGLAHAPVPTEATVDSSKQPDRCGAPSGQMRLMFDGQRP